MSSVFIYNENTVHGGSFPEGPTGFGKETMYEKMKRTILLCLIGALACGCTRREQLVFQDRSAFSAEEAAESDAAAVGGAKETAVGESLAQDAALPAVQAERVETSAADADRVQAAEETTIYVHVCGAVQAPGVYELPVGSRVYEAVQAADGFAADADTDYVNQAQRLTDGVKLIIPTLEQTQMAAEEAETASVGGIVGEDGPTGISVGDAAAEDSSDGRININTATEAQLCQIPGIGKTRAAAIVAYRQEKGGFDSVEDIMNVSGIKEGTYAKIKDSIRIN